jgi:prophage regulatory protein
MPDKREPCPAQRLQGEPAAIGEQRPETVSHIIEQDAEHSQSPRKQRQRRHPPVRGPPPGLRILREQAVLELTAMPRSKMWEGVKDGTFPRPVKLSERGRAVGWLLEELLQWREQRIAARDNKRTA